MKYRAALVVLALVLATQVVLFFNGIRDPCGMELGGIWPWSTAAVFMLGVACWVLSWHAPTRIRNAILLLLVAVVLADLGQARYRSRLGSLGLGGVESLVRHASSAESDHESLTCFAVVASATQYGPDVARTFILNNFSSTEQVRLFRLMAQAIPSRAPLFNDDAARILEAAEPTSDSFHAEP